jgi:aminoglycoside phosphotransferase (APT) family kinase protein
MPSPTEEARSYDRAMIDLEQAVVVARQVPGVGQLSVVQSADDHVVFEGEGAIVKCGTRDEFGVEAWACDRARSLGLPAPRVIAIDTSASLPFLVLSKVRGVPLCDSRLSVDVATRAARQAGALLRRLHEVGLPGFGWADPSHARRTGEVRGKSRSWVAEIAAELDPALEVLVDSGALDAAQAERLRDEMSAAIPILETITDGRFLHGDLGRMHIFVDPGDGTATGLIDWGDVQVGDPAWDLAITAVHLASPSEGILRVHHATGPNLFPDVLVGYEPSPELTAHLGAVHSFYVAYRQAWVARLGPGEGGVPNPSLAMLRKRLVR